MEKYLKNITLAQRSISRFRLSSCRKTFCIFGFETTDLHSLLKFEYSLLDNEGKRIKYQKGEDKTPALNFTIQIIS